MWGQHPQFQMFWDMSIAQKNCSSTKTCELTSERILRCRNIVIADIVWQVDWTIADIVWQVDWTICLELHLLQRSWCVWNNMWQGFFVIMTFLSLFFVSTAGIMTFQFRSRPDACGIWWCSVVWHRISCCTFVMCAVPCQTSFVLGVSTLSNFVTPDLFYFAQRVSLFIPFLRSNPVCFCSQCSSGCCAFAWWHTFPQWWTCADIWGWMVTFSNLHWARIRGEKFWILLWLTHPLWNPHEIFLDPPLPWVNASSCLWHNLPNLLKSTWRD